jgi:putative ABC transport system permease protein
VRLATGRSRVDADIDDELAFHFAAAIDELVARGMSPDAARREAERRFGDLGAWRAELRTIDGAARRSSIRREWLDALALDLRLAARGLARSPGLVAAIVLTLALGLGANATMFDIVDRLLLRPPAHVVAPERTGRIWTAVPNRFGGPSPFYSQHNGYAVFDAIRQRQHAFSHVAAVTSNEHTLGRGEAARPARVSEVTGDFFALLGVRPLLGRLLAPDDDREDANGAAVVISWDMWQHDYGAASSVLGQTLVIDQRPFTIVGVTPRGFTGAELGRVGAWITMAKAGYAQRLTPDWRTSGNMTWLQIIGRLAPGATREQAGAELTTIYRAARSGPDASEARRQYAAMSTMTVGDLLEERGPRDTQQARVAVWLAGVALVVLLVACANVANLLVARAIRREREVAVQLALGVASGRLVRQFVLESTMLALAGGAAALLVAVVGAKVIARVLLPDIAWEGSWLDGRVLLVTLAVVGVTVLLVALSPVLQARRIVVHDALRATGRGSTGRASRLRTTLTVAQASLSVLLLVGAGLFVRSLHRARGLDLGLDAGRVLVAYVDVRTAGMDRDATERFWNTALERVAALPGVERASLSATAPFSSSWNETLFVPGYDSLPTFPDGGPYQNPVTPGYLRTVGTPLRRGRDLGPGDVAGSTPVVVINEAMARRLWPRTDPIGLCFRIEKPDSPCRQIVGIAAESRRGSLRDTESVQYFLPIAQLPEKPRGIQLFVRARGDDATPLVPAVRRVLREIDPRIPYPQVETIQWYLDPQLRPWRLGATLFTAFGALALVVASVGLYGVLAYDVAQRTRELGVRSALGARTRDVAWLVLRRGLAVAATGIALGLVAALVAARWVADLLFDVPARDPVTLGTVAVVLLLVAFAASLVPAWRAARVNPQVALRAE